MSSSAYRYNRSSLSDYPQRVVIPVQRVNNTFDTEVIEPYPNKFAHLKDTTTQWIKDPITGRDKFRIKIDIEGFNKSDVQVRVDGSTLLVYGERIENKSQGASKKIIEKSYELPVDVDRSSPYVSYASPITMQVDFPALHSPQHSGAYQSSRKMTANDLSNRKISMSPHSHSPEIEDYHENRTSSIPVQRILINSRNASLASAPPTTQVYQFRKSVTSPIINTSEPVYKQTASKMSRRRATPTVGFQTAYYNEHQRLMSPALSSIMEEDHTAASTDTDSALSRTPSSYFPRDFNSDAFYRSAFQPEIFSDDRHQRYIEMRLDVQNYKPADIKVSINENDLIVHVERTNFYKRITLPSNADLASLSLHYHRDKNLYITVKLLDEHSSFRYI